MIVMQEFGQHLEKATKGAFSRCVVDAFLVGWFAIQVASFWRSLSSALRHRSAELSYIYNEF